MTFSLVFYYHFLVSPVKNLLYGPPLKSKKGVYVLMAISVFYFFCYPGIKKPSHRA